MDHVSINSNRQVRGIRFELRFLGSPPIIKEAYSVYLMVARHRHRLARYQGIGILARTDDQVRHIELMEGQRFRRRVRLRR